METILVVLKIILWVLVLDVVFNVTLKVFDGKNELVDSVIEDVKLIFKYFKKCYGIIGQYIRKESHKVINITGAIFGCPKIYDSD